MSNKPVVTLPTPELLERLEPLLGTEAELHVWPMDGPSGLGHIDLAVQPYMSPATVLDVLQGEDVAAVQAQSLGFDNVNRHLPEGVSYSNAVGVHEGATAELTLALVLAAQRDLHIHLADQPSGQWNQRFAPGLLGLTVLVVGVGGVGTAIVKRLEPFECTVVRSASRARTDDMGEVHGPEDLPRLVSEADIVILGAPLTEQTRGMFDEQLIGQMKQGALLVNIGRGPLVDTDAMTAAAQTGRIRVALDVVDPEPLPSDHPLWRTPGVLITPHVGGRSTSMEDRVVDLLVGQVNRLRAGEPLAHRVL
ncbi:MULTISPECIES: NAD(P)-dependent oxidoreductase [unclassified Luteococcus]|uniref:NAD(P)-dependent oxidoreductase n=1 Tax=unclassified Luteococcus TaxID=2639923 RepID=UPI00313E689A